MADPLTLGLGIISGALGLKNLFGGGSSSVPQAPTVPTLPVGGNLLNMLPYLQRGAMRPVTTGLGVQAGNTYQEQMNRLLANLRASGLRGSTGTTGSMAQGAGALAGSLEGVAQQGVQAQQAALLNFAQLLHSLYTGNQSIPFQNYNAKLQQYGAEQEQQAAQLDAIKQLAALWQQVQGQKSSGTGTVYNGNDWIYDPYSGQMVTRGG